MAFCLQFIIPDTGKRLRRIRIRELMPADTGYDKQIVLMTPQNRFCTAIP